MATKKKVSEKKVEKNNFLAIQWGEIDHQYFSSLENFIITLIEDGWDEAGINCEFTFFTIKDGEICEVKVLEIDIPKVAPKITFKVSNKES